MTQCIYYQDYEFICLHFVVRVDCDFGLHRLRTYRPSPGCCASIRNTNSDSVRDYGLDLKPPALYVF